MNDNKLEKETESQRIENILRKKKPSSIKEINWEDCYYNLLKQYDALNGQIRYCTFKTYWNGLKNRIRLKDFKLIHKGVRCYYKSFNIGKNRFHFIKEFDGTDTYFYKEYSKNGQNYIKFYYIKKDGKINFKTFIKEDSGNRESC